MLQPLPIGRGASGARTVVSDALSSTIAKAAVMGAR